MFLIEGKLIDVISICTLCSTALYPNPICVDVARTFIASCHCHSRICNYRTWVFMKCALCTYNLHIYHNTTTRYNSKSPQFLGWPEVLISFSLTPSHSVPRHYTSCRGLVLLARECVSPAEAVPIRSLVTGRLASGVDRTRNPLRKKRACSHYTTQPTK